MLSPSGDGGQRVFVTRRNHRQVTAVKLWNMLEEREAERPQLQQGCSCEVAGLDRKPLNTKALLQKSAFPKRKASYDLNTTTMIPLTSLLTDTHPSHLPTNHLSTHTQSLPKSLYMYCSTLRDKSLISAPAIACRRALRSEQSTSPKTASISHRKVNAPNTIREG